MARWIIVMPKMTRGSEVMSAVETKSPGTFTRGVREKFSDEKATKIHGD